jgi:hypothetical protein
VLVEWDPPDEPPQPSDDILAGLKESTGGDPDV